MSKREKLIISRLANQRNIDSANQMSGVFSGYGYDDFEYVFYEEE
jgi:hypothetical protein